MPNKIIDLTGCCTHLDGEKVVIYKVIPKFVKNVDLELLQTGSLLRAILIKEPSWVEAYDNRGIISTVQILSEEDKTDIAELVAQGDHVIHIHVVKVNPAIFENGSNGMISIAIGQIHVSCFDQFGSAQKTANVDLINKRFDDEISSMSQQNVSDSDIIAIQNLVEVARIRTLAERNRFTLSVARSNKRSTSESASDLVVFSDNKAPSTTSTPCPAPKRARLADNFFATGLDNGLFPSSPVNNSFNNTRLFASQSSKLPLSQTAKQGQGEEGSLSGSPVKIIGGDMPTGTFVHSEFPRPIPSTPVSTNSNKIPATPTKAKFIDPTDIYAGICASSSPMPSSASRESVFKITDFLESIENARRSIYHTLGHLVETVVDGERIKSEKANLSSLATHKVDHSKGNEYHAVLDFVKGRANAAVVFSEHHNDSVIESGAADNVGNEYEEQEEEEEDDDEEEEEFPDY